MSPPRSATTATRRSSRASCLSVLHIATLYITRRRTRARGVGRALRIGLECAKVRIRERRRGAGTAGVRDLDPAADHPLRLHVRRPRQGRVQTGRGGAAAGLFGPGLRVGPNRKAPRRARPRRCRRSSWGGPSADRPRPCARRNIRGSWTACWSSTCNSARVAVRAGISFGVPRPLSCLSLAGS